MTKTVRSGELHRVAVAIYTAANTPRTNAETVARHQVGANLAGHDSHGVQLLPSYITRIKAGHIIPAAKPRVIQETAGTLAVDGQWGFGPVISEWTMSGLIERARAVGVAAATIRDQSHVGRLSDYPTMAARAGLVGMMFCDSGQGPKQVVPFGGREVRLGTNPLCIAFPSEEEGDVCIDIATSAVAAAKLKVARAKGESIPAGWALNKQGEPTTDPNDFFDGGALLPLGGPEGHKGYGLSFAVEALAALLPGLGFGIDPHGRHNDGCLMIVLDPERLGVGAAFPGLVSGFVRFLKDTPLAANALGVFYPGELEHRTAAHREETGIPLPDATWNELTDIASDLGLDAESLLGSR